MEEAYLTKEKGYWRIRRFSDGLYLKNRDSVEWCSISSIQDIYQNTKEGNARKFLQDHNLKEVSAPKEI